MNKIFILIFFSLFVTFNSYATHQPGTVIIKPGPSVCTESCSGGNCIRSCT